LLSSSSAPSAPVVEERAKVARTKADKNFMVNFIMGKSFFDSLLHRERERESVQVLRGLRFMNNLKDGVSVVSKKKIVSGQAFVA
jgi:hypothetical protein